MRLKIAIVLAVLGLVVLGLGIGQRTIWLPPANVTVPAATGSAAAPLTVIEPDLLKARDGQFTMTIKNDGPIQLAVGRVGDVDAWVGDAAHTTIGAPNAELTELSTESVDGAKTVPNPAGSDLWVSEEKGTTEMSYTWEAPGHGDWALLLSADGEAAAPTDISITVDNEAGTPWAVPLMIIGSALLALAALLFLLAPRKPAPGEAAGGRRSAGRGPNDPATGAIEVERILAASTTAKTATSATPGGAPATPEVKDSGTDAAAALPKSLQDPAAAATELNPPVQAPANPEQDDANAENASAKEDKDADHGDDSSDGGNAAEAEAAPQTEAGDGNAAAKDKKDKGTMNRVRWVAALAAVVLAGGTAGPAMAETATPGATGESSVTAAPQESPTTGFPNLLDTQIQRIASSVATVVASGDNAKNAKELEPRVTGTALEMRAANYKVRAKIAKHAAPEPVNATELLAKVIPTTETWPRAAMFVTKGEGNEVPQLMTLVQQSARENYKLTSVTPLLPGQTFPSVDKEGTTELPLDSAEGLLMSPEAATAALSDRLTKEESKFSSSFAASVYVDSVMAMQKKIKTDAKDADIVFTHKPDLENVETFRTADGGAMVVVRNNFGISSTSKDDATLNVGEEAAVFTGGRETTKGFTLNYAEPVVMYIPATGGAEQITILSANRAMVSGSFK